MTAIEKFVAHCVKNKKGIMDIENQLLFCSETGEKPIMLLREITLLLHGDNKSTVDFLDGIEETICDLTKDDVTV